MCQILRFDDYFNFQLAIPVLFSIKQFIVKIKNVRLISACTWVNTDKGLVHSKPNNHPLPVPFNEAD